MAERRMMAKSIIDTDIFLDMPISSQNLYFHMLLRADDDGFISNPKSILRTIGASEDDLKLLLVKQYIFGFESGVVVIKDWKVHNYIRSDRYKPSQLPEKNFVCISETGSYELNNTETTSSIPTGRQLVYQRYPTGIPTGRQLVYPGKDRLGKDRLGKDKDKNCRLSDKSSTVVSEIIDYLNQKTGKHFRKSIANTTRAINARIKEGFTVDDFKAVIDKKVIEWGKDERMKQYLRPQTLFGTKFESYLNQDLVEHKTQTDKAIDVAKNVIEYYQEREEQDGKDGYGKSFGTVTDRF